MFGPVVHRKVNRNANTSNERIHKCKSKHLNKRVGGCFSVRGLEGSTFGTKGKEHLSLYALGRRPPNIFEPYVLTVKQPKAS